MRRIALIALLLAACILGWLYWQQNRPVPFVVSGLIETDDIRVGSRVGGRVAEVVAVEGQTVKAGDLLYRLDPFTLGEQFSEAKARLELTESEHARLLKLREQDQAAQKEFDEAIQAMKGATANVAAIEKQIGELEVRSPCACVVEAIELRPGDMVAANAPSVSLLDLSRMWVRAYVPEDRLGQVRLNQRVPIQVDSFPGRRYMAHVMFIAHEAEFTPRNVQTPEERSKQVFRIKVSLDEGKDVLRVGMAADVLLGEAALP